MFSVVLMVYELVENISLKYSVPKILVNCRAYQSEIGEIVSAWV